MKKLLLSVVVLLAIVWAGATCYVGRQMESALQQFIDAGNKQTDFLVFCTGNILTKSFELCRN